MLPKRNFRPGATNRFLALFTALLALTASACRKEESNTAPQTGASRFWKVGSTTHVVNNYTTTSDTYTAYDTAADGIGFSFASFPPTAGSYQVIDNSASLGAGQVKVYVFSFGSNANTYFATGSDGTKATVSFVNNRIKIELPDTWAKKASTPDSLKISAQLSPLSP